MLAHYPLVSKDPCPLPPVSHPSRYSSESSRGWVSFKDAFWEECEVTDSNDTQLTLRLSNGQVKSFPRKQIQFCYRNPSAVEAADDFLTLPHLDEPNILHSLRVRYWQGHVYSYTGPILIAVNPWRQVDIYNINVMEAYKAGRTKAPHIFDIAAKSYRSLVGDRKNQCILISGESGSGKTESTKFVLQVLTAVGENRTGASASIEQQVMLTNPVLEAFGNAKTLRNDNSSRFGKWINVHFDRKGTIAGAEIKTYLLEKARVIHQTNGERNYHIFYQVCGASSQQKMLKDLGLAEAGNFNYSKTCLTASGIDDTKSFDRTKQALHFIGFDAASQQNIFAAVSVVLHVGNLKITENSDGNAIMESDRHLQAVSQLLRVDPNAIKKAICERMITAGTDVMMKPETGEKANQCRDALAKALYSKLFDYIVKCVNTALKLKTNTVTMQVSVLDIFGFEVFESNHFEQFCINYANEKLQLHFNHYNFMLERQLYAKEGIELVESDFVDNSGCVDLIEAKGWGVQACLDDVCIMPKGEDATFLQKLIQTPQIKANGHFADPKKNNRTFIVNHYAGSVAYDIDGFCEKNKDILAVDLVQMLQTSSSKFFEQIFDNSAAEAAAASMKPGRKGGGGGGSVAYKSVSATFKTDLASLMEAINAADPHFVRCVNPNAEKKASLFNDQKAIEQLRCGGVIEAVRMARESYPARFVHHDFVGTFAVICPEACKMGDSKQQCLAMVQHMKLAPKQYRLGKTMILLKREAVDLMEKERARLLGGKAVILQSAGRRAAVLEGLEDEGSEDEGDAQDIEGYIEDEGKDEPSDTPEDLAITPADNKRNQALSAPEDVPPVSPLCIRIQVHAEGITEALLFHVDLLASAIRQAVMIKDHKSFLKVHPNTFRGQAAIEWLRGHAARALFGSEAEKEKNQQLSRSVALLLGQKLLAVGVFRQVTGSLTKPLEDPNALFRFHEDEKEGPLLNCRSIWFQNAREPLLVVSELLYTMLNLRLSLSHRPGYDLKDSEELNNFTAAAAELQLVNINDLSRIQLLAFFLNAYNLMVLHAHVVRGSVDNTDFKSQKIPFTRDNQYMIAAYNYSLAEIEERLFCRVLRAKFPKKSDKSRAPEPRVHFALSLGCASSPRIRIYQPETLDEDLQQAAIEYLTTNAPKNRLRMQQAASFSGSGRRVCEVVLPKIFKWYKDDFGFNKQEILVRLIYSFLETAYPQQAYYASFMPEGMKEELMDVARSNNFIIKYDKFDWNLHLTKACSEASRQPQRLIANHSSHDKHGPSDANPTTLGANQVFTPSLHENQGRPNISDKAGRAQPPQAPAGRQMHQVPPGQKGPMSPANMYKVPAGRGGAGGMPGPDGRDDSGGFMC
eukprot:756782-Hanusia_phi.AAC.1